MNRLEELKQKAKDLKDRYKEVTASTKLEIEMNRSVLDPILKKQQYARDDLDELKVFKYSLEVKPYVEKENILLKKLKADIESNNLTDDVIKKVEEEIREEYRKQINEEIEETIKLRQAYLESFSKVKSLYDEGNREIYSLILTRGSDYSGLYERCSTKNFNIILDEVGKINKNVKFNQIKKKGIF